MNRLSNKVVKLKTIGRYFFPNLFPVKRIEVNRITLIIRISVFYTFCKKELDTKVDNEW